ncbi:UDP-3-O-acyl-N-acetylglucosamine deacetylase [Amylibacter ulvae]|uniref:UDP-3-O-acyl-N-acetylglucosamine deacetylase n=1 Tax=Paramylibacter ulvae TaxID=1651968 RepID=A0ABQ3D236_9RHOB|nr:UDP-3-O-acyl-N-acetylglucosamine deacetylase [Amylibacter ulvae]GHA52774.1 UDP-3-O-acyl-N-acetylglucosamine deacetylase [Amylibacter ulvae]
MQKTLKSPVTLRGTGLHSGKPANLRLVPAGVGHGIVFHRVDVTDRDQVIPANYLAVNDTQLCTRVSNNEGVEVSTIEHLMAALAGTGVNNAVIEIDGPEVPIMDGSAISFVREILAVGLADQDAPVRAIRVLRDVTVTFDDVIVTLSPADNLEIDFSIDFSDRAIGEQHKKLNMANGTFVRELSDCRTFVRRNDVEMLQANGLALGGSLDNAIVVDQDKVLNPEGFRRADECVRHKMLDALGDLYLAGAPILGRYVGNRAGHRATNELLRALFATDGAWEWVTCSPEQDHDLPGTDIKSSDFPTL